MTNNKSFVSSIASDISVSVEISGIWYKIGFHITKNLTSGALVGKEISDIWKTSTEEVRKQIYSVCEKMGVEKIDILP